MINPKQFISYVLRPTLEPHGLWSPSVEQLLMGTMAQESHCGEYLRQLGGGPAHGVFQMEPMTLQDLWENYLKYRPDKAQMLRRKGISGLPYDSPLNLIYSLPYATLAARLHYLRVPEGLPEVDDWEAMATYWKEHYNTPLGRGTPEEFLHNVERFNLNEITMD